MRQTPNSGLRHTSFRKQVPESGVRSVGVRISPSQHEPFLVEVKTILKRN